MRRNEPALPDTLEEFCAMISGKEQTAGGSAALAILDDADRNTLGSILAQYQRNGSSAEIRRRARVFLTKYREQDSHAGVLTPAERQRLDGILSVSDDRKPQPPRRPRQPHEMAGQWRVPRLALVAVIVSSSIAISTAVYRHLSDSTSGQSANTNSQVNNHRPVQQVPAVPTDLQRTESRLGPWQTISPSDQRPQTSQPAVLLMDLGNTEASTKWAISTTGGWFPDQTASVDSIMVHGTYVDFTDANGTPYVVGINQPFVLGDVNPGTVFRITPGGTPESIPLASATRVPLK